jgi:hypothetical protein
MENEQNLALRYVHDALNYIATADFRNGVTVEIAGMLVDILLLIVFVPSLVWMLNLRRRQRHKSMATFFTIQFVREMADLLLRCGGAIDVSALLNKALAESKLQSLSSHPFYGNTEDLFSLLKLRMNEGEHIEGYKHLNDLDIERILLSSQEILNRLDQYIFIFNSLDLTDYSERYFQARMFVFPLRDHFQLLQKSRARDLNDTDEIKALSTGTASYFHQWFTVERLLPDRRIRRRIFAEYTLSFIQLPLLLLYRLVAPSICKALKIPFHDPVGSNFFQSMLTALCSAHGTDLNLISEKTAVNLESLVTYCMGHRSPSQEEALRILLAIRPLVDPTIWCHLVIETITNDIKGRNHKMIFLDSLHASGTWWLMMLTNGMAPQGIDLGRVLMTFVLRR